MFSRVGPLLAVGLALLTGGTLATGAGARSSLPLSERVLSTNEIPDYAPTSSSLKPLSLSAYAKVAEISPSLTAQLGKHGFRRAIQEQLKGPSAPPPGSESSSSVTQFRSAKGAASMLALITRDYYSHSPGEGIVLHRFRISWLPVATAARYTRGNVTEYDVLFTDGPYAYEEDIFTLGGTLTQAKFLTGLHHLYERVREP